MISIIIPCGYFNDSELEKDRLIKFIKQLESFKYVRFNDGDELIFVESSPRQRLKSTIKNYANQLNVSWQYIYIEPRKEDDGFFNQSLVKNLGTKLAKNDFVLYINSDIILQNNALEQLKASFEFDKDKFIICARHDIFLDNSEINEDFFNAINIESNYETKLLKLQDSGWYYNLKIEAKIGISSNLKIFTNKNYINKLNYDFLSGYIVFGDFFAYKKEYALKYPFDENCLALTDAFIRDILFSNIKALRLFTLHSYTSCFHLSGKDYQGQTKEGDPKRIRLHRDQLYLTEKYPELYWWSIFGYHKEYKEFIDKRFTKEQVQDLIEKYSTDIHWKYFTDREDFTNYYNIKK